MNDLSARPPSPVTPTWVKVFGVLAVLFVVGFVVAHLAGSGFGPHMHGGAP